MAKTVTATAKNNSVLYLCKESNGISFDKKRMIKNQSIILELISAEKILDGLICAILGNTYFLFKYGDIFAYCYSGDFELSNTKNI